MPTASIPSVSSTAPSVQDNSGIPRPMSYNNGILGSEDVVSNVEEASEYTEQTLCVVVF